MCSGGSERFHIAAAGLLAPPSGSVSMQLPEPFVVFDECLRELKAVTAQGLPQRYLVAVLVDAVRKGIGTLEP